MLPIILAVGGIALFALILSAFTKGPKGENDTMVNIQERLKREEEIAERKRIVEEEERKIREERESLARLVEDLRKAEMKREEQERRRKLKKAEAASKRQADEQKQRDQQYQDQQRQAAVVSKLRNEETERRREEEEMAAAKQRNEEEKRRLVEKEKSIQDRERSLGDDFAKVERLLEQERTAREMAENGVQPILWPTHDEYQEALKNIQYNHQNYHFAISGKAGSGKSSLINAFLDLGPKDLGAASTGTTETTLTIGRYHDPGNQPPRSQTVWFDVPGAGTQNFSSWQYFNNLGLFVFDLIIVAIGDRFEETDCQILQKCRQFEIPAFIVRSKADQHILNSMKEDDQNINSPDDNEECYRTNREEFINSTEKMVREELMKAGLPDQNVYIVSRDILRETYRGSLGVLGSLEGLKTHPRCIHEVNLVQDLIRVAIKRRCGTEETAETTSGINTAEARRSGRKGQRKWQKIDSAWIKRVLYLPYPINVDELRIELRAQNPALPARCPIPPNMYSSKVAVLYFHPTVDIPSEVTAFGRALSLARHIERASKNPTAERTTAATRESDPQNSRTANSRTTGETLSRRALAYVIGNTEGDTHWR